MIKEISIFI